MFLAWSKQERAGLLLEQTLAALAPVALLALDLTGRPVPGPLAALAEAKVRFTTAAALVHELIDAADERRQLPSAPKPNGQKLKHEKFGNNQVGLRPTRLATRQLHGEHSCQGAAQRPTEWPTIPPVNGPNLLRD